MSGWGTIKAIRALEERVDALGLEMTDPNQGRISKYNPTEQYSDRVSLQPKGDSLPHYSRDATVWTGSLEELSHWLNGVEWARGYELILKTSDEKKRKAAENTERNKQLMATINKGKLVQGKVRGIGTATSVYEEDDVKVEESPF